MNSLPKLLISGALGGAFALSVTHYMGPTVHLLLYATLLLLSALLLFALVATSNGTICWSRIHTPLGVYTFWLVVLMFTSTLPGNTILFLWVLGSLPIVLLLCAGFTQAEWHRLFLLFLLGGVTSACWGIGEFLVSGRRADGPLVDPNLWCAVNNLLFFGVLAIYLSLGQHRPRYLVLLLIFSCASLVAYSRVGTLVSAAAFAFVVVVAMGNRQIRPRILLAVCTVCVSLTFVYGNASLEDATHHSEGYTLDTEVQGWSQRFAMWNAALEIYSEHPLVGVGPGTFKVHYPRVRGADDITNSGNFVHNDYLQFLCEGGPVLLLFLVALVVLLLVNLVRCLGTRDLAETRRLVLIVAMGTALVHGLMSFTLFSLSVQMLFGLYFVNIASPFTVERYFVLTKPWLARVGAVLAVVYLAGVLVLDAISNDIVYDNYRLPLTESLKQDRRAYLSTIRFLKAVRPQHPANHFALATLYRRSMDEQTDPESRFSLALVSALSYQRGIELNPYNYRVRLYFSQLLQENPALMQEEEIYQSPLRLLEENISLAPVFIENQMDLADYFERNGDEDVAYGILLHDALPWADLRHARYAQYRLALHRKIYRRAVQRSDETGLKLLLASMLNVR